MLILCWVELNPTKTQNSVYQKKLNSKSDEFKTNWQEPVDLHPWLVRCYCWSNFYSNVVSNGEYQDKNANVKRQMQ